MGTPHRGSDNVRQAEIVQKVARFFLRQPNDQLVQDLSEDSNVLESQRNSFSSISEKMPVVCIYEEIPTAIGMVSIAIPTVNTSQFSNLE